MQDLPHNKAGATLALETLFKSVGYMNSNSDILLVKVENCTIYIPVTNLDKSRTLEFRKYFKHMYDLTQQKD